MEGDAVASAYRRLSLGRRYVSPTLVSPSGTHVVASLDAERRRNVRSSIADLRVLYANQMQTLHMQIEGSSKFVPTTPGRHVVMEIDNIVTLNSATYKVDHSVRFVLLDDAVLVARKRRRRNNTESDKLVAEKCWPLSEMLVLDTKDSPSTLFRSDLFVYARI